MGDEGVVAPPPPPQFTSEESEIVTPDNIKLYVKSYRVCKLLLNSIVIYILFMYTYLYSLLDLHLQLLLLFMDLVSILEDMNTYFLYTLL